MGAPVSRGTAHDTAAGDDQDDELHAPGPALLDAAQLQLRTAVEQLLTAEHHHLNRGDADPALDDHDRLEIARLDIVALGDAIRARAAAAATPPQRTRVRALLARIDRTRARQHRLAAAIDARRRGTGIVPPLLDRLVDAVAASSNRGGAPSMGATRNLIGLQAADIVADIDTTTRWGLLADPHPARAATVARTPVPLADGTTGQHVRPVRDLPAQLRRWAARASWWRVVAPRYLLDVAELAQWWTEQARAILDATTPLSLAGACPACGHTLATIDEAGQPVTRAVLQLDRVLGVATCQACHTSWRYEHLEHLALVLEQQRAEQRAQARAAHRADTVTRDAVILLDRYGLADPDNVAIVVQWLLTGRAPRPDEVDSRPGQTA